MMIALTVKRISDILLSLISIIIFFPLLLFIGILVKLTIPGNVVFAQNRVGKDRKVFRILKFRTMPVGSDQMETVTGVGGFLRRTKLDELPQLVNILLGDMSFVGPRPYIEEESKNLPDARFEMRPGITGLAQVNGNTFLSWEERTEYDVEYIRNWNMKQDISVLIRTVKVVLDGEEACVRHR